MTDQLFDLQRLIAPTELSTFFVEYLERRPLIIARRQSGYYSELLTLADLDHILTSRQLTRPAVRLVKRGSRIEASQYANDMNWGGEPLSGLVDVDKLLTEYQAGATVLLPSLNRHWRPLGLLCWHLEQSFTQPVHANVYLTPPASQAFAPHYDTHDTIIIQLEGVKHWRVFDSPVLLPHPAQPYPGVAAGGKPKYEIDLAAGDLLYMPRGFVHEALTSDSVSLHVTICVSPFTWVEVFSEALAQLRLDERFRKSLPIGFANQTTASEAVHSEFKTLLEALPDVVDLDAVLEKISARFFTGRPAILDGHVLELNQLDRVQADTMIRRREGVLYRLLEADDSISLQFHGKKIPVPKSEEAAMRFMLEADDFSADMLPGKLKARDKLELVRRLIREGFLTFNPEALDGTGSS